jgi:GT2 family glycosyltransferase
MPDSKELSIIIVNYRSEQYLENCLASLFSELTVGIDFEVIVVNNDEAGKLRGVLRDFSLVRVIQQNRNSGFGAANNLGAARAGGRLLWFLNPDTEIKTGIKSIIETFNKDSGTGIVGAGLVTADSQAQPWAAGAEVGILGLIRNNLGFPASKMIWNSEKTREAAWVSGGAMFVKKEVFAATGGFDEKFFMYYEDIDLCRRVRIAGKKVVYCPEVKVKHIGGSSWQDEKTQKSDYYKSQNYYFAKHYGRLQSGLVTALRKIFANK